MKVLVVEDETRMLELLRRGLEEEGHRVVCSADGVEGLDLAVNSDFDAVILDIMLPHMNGYDVARQLRSMEVPVPVLMLTARDSVEDVVQGLDVGADDYLTKPFSFDELLARLEAVRRRAQIRFPSVLQAGDLSMDLTTRTVTRAHTRIDLTRTEYTLLERLMRNAGAIVPRQSLIEAVWGSDRPIEDNTLDAFMRLLRNKIEAAGKHKLIHTARGAGYGLRPPLHQ